MKTIKLKIHSSFDLITNSSTVIFTYSDGSLTAVEELVNEMLKVFNSDKTFNDIFYADVFLEDDYNYYEWMDEEELEQYGLPTENTLDYINDIRLKVLKKEIEQPEWMKISEKRENYSGYPLDTVLELLPKDEKYIDLSNKLLNYLYSTSHEATRDG